MNNFNLLNKIVKNSQDELNRLYENLDNDVVLKCLEICKIESSKSVKLALLRRVVDLKEEAILNELKKLNKSQSQIDEIMENLYEFVANFHTNRHEKLIQIIKKDKILDDFFIAVLELINEIGKNMNEFFKIWKKEILQTTNKELNEKFANLNEILEFLKSNNLFQTNPDKTPSERSYGAILKTYKFMLDSKVVDENTQDAQKIEEFYFVPYSVKFPKIFAKFDEIFENGIANLKLKQTNSQNLSIINYFEKLKIAFATKENDKVLQNWQDAEKAWMDVKSPLQIGHPLEYYEDNLTRAVAPEWDIRLKDDSDFDEENFKSNIKNSFLHFYEKIKCKNENLKSCVLSNIDKTQIYISSPMIFYGADLNGLFSAQVVPNDEFVSKECGKKIFAFLNFVYENAKARPFMKLSKMIFSQSFLDYGREILFNKPEIWKKVYQISTIGHEFGHIFFIENDTENLMNIGGEFKYIEEYKATTGGLVNFFLNEIPYLKMPVFYDVIKRSIGLISWQEILETRAYYCEGLIHLSLLFESGVLDFDGKNLRIDFSEISYERFKALVLKNYQNLAAYYVKKTNASEFLEIFAEKQNEIYLPKNKKVRDFVKFYYEKYQKFDNEIDESDDRQKWL